MHDVLSLGPKLCSPQRKTPQIENLLSQTYDLNVSSNDDVNYQKLEQMLLFWVICIIPREWSQCCPTKKSFTIRQKR